MKTIFTLLSASAVVFLMASFGGSENSDYPGGSPAGYSGSPGDGRNCTSCHGGTAATETGLITSDIPATGYVPGETYIITASVTGSGGKGFQVSPQDITGNLLGTLTAGSNNHLNGSGKYVTQNSGIGASTATWTFSWTAPVAGTGNVTFYGAFTVSMPVTLLSTMVAEENTSLGISNNTNQRITISPNPCKDYFTVDHLISGGKLSITDMNGKMIRSVENLSKGINRIDVAGLNSGRYVVVLENNGKKMTGNLVVRSEE